MSSLFTMCMNLKEIQECCVAVSCVVLCLFELVLHIISYYIALKPGFSSLESYERA